MATMWPCTSRGRGDAMTYEEKVAWLRRYQQSLRQEREFEQELLTLRSQACRVTPLLSSMPTGTPDGQGIPVLWSASFRRSKSWNARLPSVQIPAATSSQSSIKLPMPAIRKFCAEDTCLASALNRSQWRCTWNTGGSGGGISRQSKCCFFSRFEHFGAFLSRFKQISALFQAFWDHNPFTFRGHSVIII